MSDTTLTKAGLKKLLIVEDEADICLLLNIMLKEEDIELDHVNTLAKAKAHLELEQPALILLDNRLPDGLGIDFIEFLKTNYPSVKIIMISGFLPGAIKDVALNNGADIYLEKPFTKEKIYQSVHQLLN
jgi:DNA-binding response OmpR family regulator